MFVHVLTQVKDVVSDKKLGEMRMQFWREAIDQTFKVNSTALGRKSTHTQ